MIHSLFYLYFVSSGTKQSTGVKTFQLIKLNNCLRYFFSILIIPVNDSISLLRNSPLSLEKIFLVYQY